MKPDASTDPQHDLEVKLGLRESDDDRQNLGAIAMVIGGLIVTGAIVTMLVWLVKTSQRVPTLEAEVLDAVVDLVIALIPLAILVYAIRGALRWSQ